VLREHKQATLANEQSRQIHGLIGVSRRPVSFKAVDLHLLRGVLVPAWLAPERLMMAAIAVCLSAEKFVAPGRCRRVKIDARTRPESGQCQLIKMQSGKLFRNLVAVRIHRNVAQLGGRRYGKLACIIKSLIEKCSDAVQFVYRNKCVPIRHSAPATSPRMQVMA